jgi:hypothetical protein
MLPCVDENDLPDFMPYAEDAPKMESQVFQFWISLFSSSKPAPASTNEEAEPVVPATKPDCREDPNHHFQDAGCPFIGPCPAGRCRTPETIKDVPRMQLEPQEPEMGLNAVRLLNRRIPCMLEPMDEKTPVHPEVDTMEFRPSDAKVKAFENWLKRLPL